MADDKWFIRGVATDIRQRVTDIAEQRGQTVGRVVTDLLRDALARLTDERQTPVNDGVADRLDDIERRVAALEAEQGAIQARLNDPAIYRDAPQEVPTLNARLQALEGEIEAAMLRWEELEARAASK